MAAAAAAMAGGGSGGGVAVPALSTILHTGSNKVRSKPDY